MLKNAKLYSQTGQLRELIPHICMIKCPINAILIVIMTAFVTAIIDISYETFWCVVSLYIFTSCAKYKKRVKIYSDTTRQNV